MQLTIASQNLPHEWPENFDNVVSYIPNHVTEEDITEDVVDFLRETPL